MNLAAWTAFAGFWAVFVVSPGPNAVNCIRNGMVLGLRRALPGVAAILVQATLFLWASALGVTALLAATPGALALLRWLGAAVLVGLGVRTWLRAGVPPDPAGGTRVFRDAFLIATINAKSVAGYLAVVSLFSSPTSPMIERMLWMWPTALAITAASYLGYTALGAWLGRQALGRVFERRLQRALASLFVLYGLALLLVGP